MESKPPGVDIDDEPEGESFVAMARAAMPAPSGRHRRFKWLLAILAALLLAGGLTAVFSTLDLSAQPRVPRDLASSTRPGRTTGAQTPTTARTGSGAPSRAAAGASNPPGSRGRVSPGGPAAGDPPALSPQGGGALPTSPSSSGGSGSPAPASLPAGASSDPQALTSSSSGSAGNPPAPSAQGGGAPASPSSPAPSATPAGSPSQPPGPAPSSGPAAAQALSFSHSEEVGPGSAVCCSAQTGTWWQYGSGGADDGTSPVLYHLGGETSDPGEAFDWSLGTPTVGSRWDQVRVYVWIPTHMGGAHVVYSVRDLHGTVQIPVIQESLSGWYYLGTFDAGVPGNRTSSVWVTMTYAGTYRPPAPDSSCGAAGCDAWAASLVRFVWS